MPNDLRIVLCDDHALVRDGIRSLLEEEADLRVVGEADNGREVLDLLKTIAADLLIIDIRMPVLNGLDTVKQLRAEGATLPCLMLSMHDSEEYVLQSISVGANGYLLKDASRPEFIKAVRTIIEGGRYYSGELTSILFNQLSAGDQPKPVAAVPSAQESAKVKLTRRQLQILNIITTGATNQEIADQLGLGRRTVETHRYKMMERLGVSNRSELITKARELGIL